MSQLNILNRKRCADITKLQEGNMRQEAILRRKNDEMAKIQKQLDEAREKKKQVLARIFLEHFSNSLYIRTPTFFSVSVFLE